MFLDHDHWGRDESEFVVSFERDRYIGPTDDGLAPLFLEENYRIETRFISILSLGGEACIKDSDVFEDAAIFPNRHEATRAVQWHRQECGDCGRVYDIRPL